METGRRGVGRARPQVGIPPGIGEIEFGVQTVRGRTGSPIVGRIQGWRRGIRRLGGFVIAGR